MLVDSVHLEFDRLTVLQSAFITSQSGKVTGVLGRNGTGKSCLFRCVMGGIKPQKMTLDEAFRLYEVDYDGLVGFDPKFHTYQKKQFREMSGGEARVVEMFIILKSPAEFCILDEPFSNIAPIYVERMQEMIRQEKVHKGIIVSDHLYDAIMQVSDDLYLLRDGYTFPIESREDLIKHGYLSYAGASWQ